MTITKNPYSRAKTNNHCCNINAISSIGSLFLCLGLAASVIVNLQLLFFASYHSNTIATARQGTPGGATIISTKPAPYYEEDVAAGVEKFKKERVNGWHPIHVYHGEVELDNNASISYSQVQQDEIILKLMAKLRQLDNSQQGGDSDTHFFIDLAANDSKYLSNTLRLENNGWDGLCIKPNPSYWYNLAHRSCTVVAAFVGGVEDKVPVQARLDNGVFGGIVGETMDNTKETSNGGTIVSRYTVSLLSVFRKFHVPKSIDYLSLDVEGAESLVMMDFPFDAYVFKFMTVERPKPELVELLETNGYVFVGKIVHWGETVWMHNSTALELNDVRDIVSGISGIIP